MLAWTNTRGTLDPLLFSPVKVCKCQDSCFSLPLYLHLARSHLLVTHGGKRLLWPLATYTVKGLLKSCGFRWTVWNLLLVRHDGEQFICPVGYHLWDSGWSEYTFNSQPRRTYGSFAKRLKKKKKRWGGVPLDSSKNPVDSVVGNWGQVKLSCLKLLLSSSDGRSILAKMRGDLVLGMKDEWMICTLMPKSFSLPLHSFLRMITLFLFPPA